MQLVSIIGAHDSLRFAEIEAKVGDTTKNAS